MSIIARIREAVAFDFSLQAGVVEILANIVLATMVGTLILGVVAYLAYKLRERRRPKFTASGPVGGLPLLVRYEPRAEDFDPTGTCSGAKGRPE
jgi:hypothetical protein